MKASLFCSADANSGAGFLLLRRKCSREDAGAAAATRFPHCAPHLVRVCSTKAGRCNRTFLLLLLCLVSRRKVIVGRFFWHGLRTFTGDVAGFDGPCSFSALLFFVC